MMVLQWCDRVRESSLVSVSPEPVAWAARRCGCGLQEQSKTKYDVVGAVPNACLHVHEIHSKNKPAID